MAKIHPKVEQITNNLWEKETYTIWMKSLMFHGNGWTIFNSKGEIAFRVDNYQQRCSTKVLLMDSGGQVLFSLTRKKLRIFPCWEGFKWVDSKGRTERLPWFQARRNHIILCRNVSCQVSFKCDEKIGSWYKILGLGGKSILKIIDFSGQILAEVSLISIPPHTWSNMSSILGFGNFRQHLAGVKKINFKSHLKNPSHYLINHSNTTDGGCGVII